MWPCVTVTLYLDGQALDFNKARLSQQTHFMRQQRPGLFQRGHFGLSPTAGVDFQLISSVTLWKAARNVTGTHAGCRTVWHPKPSKLEVTQEQQGLKEQKNIDWFSKADKVDTIF